MKVPSSSGTYHTVYQNGSYLLLLGKRKWQFIWEMFLLLEEIS